MRRQRLDPCGNDLVGIFSLGELATDVLHCSSNDEGNLSPRRLGDGENCVINLRVAHCHLTRGRSATQHFGTRLCFSPGNLPDRFYFLSKTDVALTGLPSAPGIVSVTVRLFPSAVTT